MKLTKTSPTPNFSLVLPGGCNAECDFCFWKRSSPLNKGNVKRFLKNLDTALDLLPRQFHQISITGGEPTISPVFDRVLEAIANRRSGWTKVVLTTNGSHLNLRDRIAGVVDHVNISRHHFNDVVNQRLMGISGGGYTRKELASAVDDLNRVGIDVNLNVVINDKLLSSARFGYMTDVLRMVAFAKSVSASSICFRSPHGNLQSSSLEKLMERSYAVRSSSSCPVCRSSTMVIDGLPVTWRSSMDQSADDKSVYELILHPNGTLSPEWRGRRTISMSTLTKRRKAQHMCGTSGHCSTTNGDSNCGKPSQGGSC